MAIELFSEFPYFQVGNRIFDTGFYTVEKYKQDWTNNKITKLW